MKKAFFTLLLSFGILLALQLAQPHLPWFRDHFKNSRFFIFDSAKPVLKAPEPWELPGAEKPSLTPGPSHTTQAQVRQLFSELKAKKRSKLRIGYFADSITEGDVITEVLRNELQKAYGGKGVGLQGIAPRDASFRVSSVLRPSKDWLRFELHDLKKDPKLPLSIFGEAYRLNDSAESGKLHLDGPPKALQPWFDTASIYWGKGRLKVVTQGKWLEFKGNKAVNRAVLPVKAGKVIDLDIHAAPGQWVYGVDAVGDSGVTVDNFTFRGNGGDGLNQISGTALSAWQGLLGYDLIILHFGINALHDGETDFRWYRALVKKYIEHMKAAFPGVRIVLVSVIDHAVKDDDAVISSDASVPYVLAAQRAAAMDEGIWFVDLYSAMGGAGTMKSWAESSPSLANKDYTHPTRRGGARLAQLLLEQLHGDDVAPK